MANYVIKEMPAGMGNGKKGRIFPKMQVYTEFDYDKVVELIHTNSPAFSQATIRGVLDTFGVILKNYLPMGHTMKIDNLGVFSLALEFADEMTEKDTQQGAQDTAPKTNYRHVKVKGVNFKVDKKLIKEINRENSFERVSGNTVSRSPYSIEERPAGLRQPQSPQPQFCLARTLQVRLRSRLWHPSQRLGFTQSLGLQVMLQQCQIHKPYMGTKMRMCQK